MKGEVSVTHFALLAASKLPIVHIQITSILTTNNVCDIESLSGCTFDNKRCDHLTAPDKINVHSSITKH